MAFAIGLARTRPDLFEVAAAYDLEEFARAVEHAARPGRRGTVLLISSRRVPHPRANPD